MPRHASETGVRSTKSHRQMWSACCDLVVRQNCSYGSVVAGTTR
jgi:hypothetical protein